MNKEWIVYIIQSEEGKLYTGITNDLKRRFEEHQKGKKGAHFFHFSGADKIVYQESHPNRSEASKRESTIKKLSREEKDRLVTKRVIK